jgi:ribosome assembly protein YihI (activator of Der GTPase)
MRRHAPATETLFFNCETQSETKQNKTKNQLEKINCASRAAGIQQKRRENSTSKKHPQTSSYKPQPLHALILTQTIAESGRPRVTDLVHRLRNLRQLSRMTTEKEQQIQQQKTSRNFILQGAETASFDSDADHRRERPPTQS